MSGVKDKKRKRVWIDSQTEEEILRGIREAKDLSEYDNLADSAYLRAKEDYLMGINFSRLLTLKYGNAIASYLHEKYSVISVGRVMTCVLGMVVRLSLIHILFRRSNGDMSFGKSVVMIFFTIAGTAVSTMIRSPRPVSYTHLEFIPCPLCDSENAERSSTSGTLYRGRTL